MKIIMQLSVLCAAVISAAPGQAAEARFGLKLFAEGFTAPTTLVPLPGPEGRMLLADQPGTIHLVNKEGKAEAKLFLDLRSRMIPLNQGFDERGLLGLALHPNFSENKRVFVVYSAPKRAEAPADWNHTLHLSQFIASEDGLTARADSEKVLLAVDQPYFNHNGGMILFGPDGYLYVALGDGGNANDQGKRPPEGNAQNLQTLLGKIIRIDVDKGDRYEVPPDNPFVGKDALPEIWAYGLRNPWRIAFDRGGDHELFTGDVGQDAFEEVNIIRKGGNYGWNIKEGFHCFDPKKPQTPPSDCPVHGANGDPLIDPILEYKNFKAHSRAKDAEGISVTGGYVYRGKAIPEWEGRYIFADWSRAWVKADAVLFAATSAGNGKWDWERIVPATHPRGMPFYINGFAEDPAGELFILTNDSNSPIGKTGKVFKIIPM